MIWLFIALTVAAGVCAGWASTLFAIHYLGINPSIFCWLFAVIGSNLAFWLLWTIWFFLSKRRKKIPFEKISIFTLLLFPIFLAVFYYPKVFWPNIRGIGELAVGLYLLPVAWSVFSFGLIGAACGLLSGMRKVYGFTLLLMSLAAELCSLLPILL